MTTTLPNAMAEAIINLWIGSDIYISLHTGDPGKNGANESTGLSRVLLESASAWNTAVDDATTGGRLVDNAAIIDFGNTSVEETYTHFGFWTASEGGTFKGGASLTTPVGPVAIGEGVRFPAGNLDLVGFGQN